MKKTIILGLLAGLTMLIVSLAFGQVLDLLFPSIGEAYKNQNIFRPWSDPLMSLYFLHPFVLGLIMAFVWRKFADLLKGDNVVKKAFWFAFYYWLIASVPGMLMTYSSFNLPLGMIVSWSLSGFIQAYAAGLIFSKL